MKVSIYASWNKAVCELAGHTCYFVNEVCDVRDLDLVSLRCWRITALRHFHFKVETLETSQRCHQKPFPCGIFRNVCVYMMCIRSPARLLILSSASRAEFLRELLENVAVNSCKTSGRSTLTAVS